MNFKYVKLVIFVPSSHANEIRDVLGKEGAGHVGNYDFCSFSTKGVGRFKPCKGANPFLGEMGKVEQVEEEKIESICEYSKVEEIVRAVKRVHPYEEPAIDVYPLLNK